LDKGVELVMDALSLMKGGENFIPKLPAMKVSDLISTMIPNCEVKVTGIRPGEKLHEMLITDDESRRTKDIGVHYVIEPVHDWWDGSHLKDNKKVSDEFRYSSDNVEVLSKEDFLKYI
ncbi:MAG: polysaccharide biosynthesis protein, partial [Candidatus Pacebacteria bacterium]|nr:polysaccharide biosynthesis protein [Candidatus Paceibacterota bacterium]